MAPLHRPFALSNLVIPADQPNHGAVQPVVPTPPPPAPSAKRTREGGFNSSLPRNRSFSHLQCLRDLRKNESMLRAASAVSTPTLSPLMLTSPKLVAKKHPTAPAVGQARAYAAFLRTKQAEQMLAMAQNTAVPVRVVKGSGGGGHSATMRIPGATRNMRSRPHVLGGLPAPPRVHRPLSRTVAGANSYCTAAVVGNSRR